MYLFLWTPTLLDPISFRLVGPGFESRRAKCYPQRRIRTERWWRAKRFYWELNTSPEGWSRLSFRLNPRNFFPATIIVNFQGCERHDGGNTQPENHQPAGGAQGSQSKGRYYVLVRYWPTYLLPVLRTQIRIRIDSGRLDQDPRGQSSQKNWKKWRNFMLRVRDEDLSSSLDVRHEGLVIRNSSFWK